MKDRFIKVQGLGTVVCMPDTAVLVLTAAVTHLSYAEANAELNSRVARLRDDFAAAGFDPEELRTIDYTVRKETDYRHGRELLKGFRVSHVLQAKLPLEQERLSRAAKALTGSSAQPELNIEFTLADPEEQRAKVLDAAVRNARSRAEVTARAAGVRLGQIVQIHYGCLQTSVASSRFSLGDAALEDAAPEFAPAAIRAEDRVTVVWEIQNAEE